MKNSSENVGSLDLLWSQGYVTYMQLRRTAGSYSESDATRSLVNICIYCLYVFSRVYKINNPAAPRRICSGGGLTRGIFLIKSINIIGFSALLREKN